MSRGPQFCSGRPCWAGCGPGLGCPGGGPRTARPRAGWAAVRSFVPHLPRFLALVRTCSAGAALATSAAPPGSIGRCLLPWLWPHCGRLFAGYYLALAHCLVPGPVWFGTALATAPALRWRRTDDRYLLPAFRGPHPSPTTAALCPAFVSVSASAYRYGDMWGFALLGSLCWPPRLPCLPCCRPLMLGYFYHAPGRTASVHLPALPGRCLALLHPAAPCSHRPAAGLSCLDTLGCTCHTPGRTACLHLPAILADVLLCRTLYPACAATACP